MGKTLDTPDAEAGQPLSDTPAPAIYTLKRPHTHAGVDYPVGHSFTAEEWDLDAQTLGWMRGIETI